MAAQDMNQLVQANIGAWQYLADAVGKSVSETKDMVKNGLISGTEGVIAILEGMNQKFAGGMQGQMQTLAGQWSNLKDQLSFILADIGKALTPFAQTVLDMAAPVLDFIKKMTEGFKNLPEGVQGSIVAFAAIAAAVGPALVAFAAFTATVSTLGSILGVAGLGGILASLAPILVPLAAAVVAAGAAWEAWKLEPVREAVTGVWQTLESFWNSTLKPIVETVEAVALAFVNFAGSLIGSGLQSAWEMLQSVGATLMEAVTALATALAPLWDAFKNVLDSLSPLLQPIEDLLGFLGRMVVALVEAGLIAAWEALKIVLGLVGEAVSVLANLIGSSLITLLGGLANMVREVSSVWDALFKPAINGAIEAVKAFLGALAQIPGVKQAIEATSSMFDDLKGKVTGAVNEARETVKPQCSTKCANTAMTEGSRRSLRRIT
jgi:phage-related protein